MPKHKEEQVADIIGTPSKLISQICNNKNDRLWLTEQLQQEGPPHKQWQHSLVLQRLETLIGKTEQRTGTTFGVQQGQSIVIAKHDHELELPLSFPESSFEAWPSGNLTGKITHGPDHEIAYTAVLLQAIEWLITKEEQGK